MKYDGYQGGYLKLEGSIMLSNYKGKGKIFEGGDENTGLHRYGVLNEMRNGKTKS